MKSKISILTLILSISFITNAQIVFNNTYDIDSLYDGFSSQNELDGLTTNNGGVAKNNILFTGIQTATQLGNNSNEPVAIDLVSSTDAILQCNTMDKTYTGIRLAGTVGGLDISGNTFGKHFTGLRYTGSMSQNGTNNIAQDNRGNIWSTNPNDYGLTSNNGGGAYNQGYASTTNQFFLQAQIFNVPQNTLYQPPTYYPKPSPSFPNLPDWFPAVISGTALFQCDQSVFFKPAPPSSPNVNSMVQTAQGIIPLSVFQTELNKQEQRLMYTEMKENMSLLSLSTVVDSFYIESESNELKEMYDAKSLKKEIEAQAPNEKLTVENTKNQRMSVMNELLVLDSLHKNDSLSLDTSYIEVRDSLLEYLMAKSEIIKTEKATIKIAEVLKTDESIIKYNTIYTQETIDYNTKYTNSLWMQVLHKNHTVSTAETNVLYSIADQCPLAGGGGVYAARSLLLMQQDTFWIDYDRCAQAGYQINKKDDEDIADIAKESLQIKIYPNPVSKKLYIQLNIPKDLALKQVWIKITSMEGKTVYKHTVEISDSKELIIDIAALELSSGVYSISLYHQKEEIHYEKLLIE